MIYSVSLAKEANLKGSSICKELHFHLGVFMAGKNAHIFPQVPCCDTVTMIAQISSSVAANHLAFE